MFAALAFEKRANGCVSANFADAFNVPFIPLKRLLSGATGSALAQAFNVDRRSIGRVRDNANI